MNQQTFYDLEYNTGYLGNNAK